jgi:tRNA A-37 threonylcarbamoyl transferase component Bud32
MAHDPLLIEVLADLTGTDWTTPFSALREAGQVTSVTEFVAQLHAAGDISTETLITLHQRSPIAVQALDIPEAYSELGQIGAGAMGTIQLVRDNALLRKMALKRLKPEGAQHPVLRGRFVNEARITARLSHPNIVPIYSLEQRPDGPVYTMKLVQGKTLKQLIGEARALPESERSRAQARLLEYFLAVCEALDYAHEQGVIHRDLKPANVMVGPYHEVYVMDWGIARVIGSAESGPVGNPETLHGLDADLTQAGEIPGTPRYMSPEQIRSPHSQLDGRSDQFALGAILFEIMALTPAFGGSSIPELLKHILKGETQPWPQGKERVPAPMRAIIGKALAPKPAGRYARVGELASDLRRYLRDEPVVAYPEGGRERTLRWMRKHQQGLLVAVLAVTLLSAGVVIYGLYRQQQVVAAAAHREMHLNQMLTRLAGQAQRMDDQFLEVEMALQEFTAVVAGYLTRFSESDQPYYYHRRFNPPDLRIAPFYKSPTSAEWTINVPSYDQPEAPLRPRMRQLSPMRHYMKRLFVRSAGVPLPITDPAQRWHLVSEVGQTIGFMTTILAEGVAMWYPGQDINAAINNYDVKKRDYYNTIGKYDFQWGTPQVESNTLRLVVPCATAVYDSQQQFKASTVFAMFVDQIVSKYMGPDLHPAIENTYLIDGKGHVLISSEKTGQAFDSHKFLTALETQPFPNREVVRQIQARQAGYTFHEHQGKARVTVYTRLQTIDWYYAATVDLERLLAQPVASRPPTEP